LIPADFPLTKQQIVELPIDEFRKVLVKGQFDERKFMILRRKLKNRVSVTLIREY
jgi:cytochrome oxidase assembly protein ShyY1